MSRALLHGVLLGLLLAPSVSRASPDPRATWVAAPIADATTGAQVRIGGARTDAALGSSVENAIMMVARIGVRAWRRVHVEVTLAGGLYDEARPSFTAPSLSATWTEPLGPLRLAIRGTAAIAVAPASQFAPDMTSSLLLHDPTIAWGGAHTGTLQASLHGHMHGLRWMVAGSVSQLIPIELPRHQTLVRADVGVGGPLGPAFTWGVELGASSDVLDEEYDEGTDLVPIATSAVHYHHGVLAMGLLVTGAWVGDDVRGRIGPSVMLELRGPL